MIDCASIDTALKTNTYFIILLLFDEESGRVRSSDVVECRVTVMRRQESNCEF